MDIDQIERRIEAIRNIVDLFEQLGGIDPQDQALFKSIARNQLLKLDSGPVASHADRQLEVPSGPLVTARHGVADGVVVVADEDGQSEELSFSEAWRQVFGEPVPSREWLSSFGLVVAEKYREEFKVEPSIQTRFENGVPRLVQSYGRDWLVKTLRFSKSQLPGEQC